MLATELDHFGQPMFLHGGLPKEVVTLDILFEPFAMRETFKLKQIVSMKWIDDGEWVRTNSGCTLNQKLCTVFDHPELMRGQAIRDAMYNMGYYLITGWSSEQGILSLGVSNEPAPSFWALKHGFIRPEEAGLLYGQALIAFSHKTDFWVDSPDDIIELVKFEPEPTLLKDP